ncbi:hypothetical protein ACF5W4_05235 [Bacillota bacterium Lsc_1132]
MPKEKLKTRPLLFIRQPEFEVNNFQMQQSYRLKVEDQESTLKRYDEDDFKEEITIEESAVVDAAEPIENRMQEPPVVSPIIQFEEVIHLAALEEKHPQHQNQEKIAEAVEMLDAAVIETETEEIVEAEEEPFAAAEEAASILIEPEEYYKTNQNEETEIESKLEIEEPIEEMETENLTDHECEPGGLEEGMEREEENTIESSDRHSEQQDELRALITRLARYPNVIERPVCEAVIDGKKIKLQVISKRGDMVKVKVARTIKKFAITDFEELSILPSWKGL